jgi:hypothetical protein
VGAEAFACGKQYVAGATRRLVEPRDFRFYVEDVGLVGEGGKIVKVAMDGRAPWQVPDVALLDFEDGTGACTEGNAPYPEPNTGVYHVTRKPADMGRFKAPTLRNIAVTAPYMHDGSVATLEDALEHYRAGGRTIATGPNAGVGSQSPLRDPVIRPLQMTDLDRSDVIAHLVSLTDEAFLSNPDFASPWVRPDASPWQLSPGARPPAGRRCSWPWGEGRRVLGAGQDAPGQCRPCPGKGAARCRCCDVRRGRRRAR